MKLLTVSTFMVLFCLVTLGISSAFSATPGLISYQGRLTTSSGAPVADGAYSIRFQIYDSAIGGSVLWNSNYQSVQAKDGLYTYLLGQDVPFPSGLFNGGNRWLGITVGVDPELTPRKQFVATGYAIASQNADSVNWSGIKNVPAGFADGVDNSNSGDITAVNTSGGLTGGATSGDASLSIANGGITSTHIGDGQIVNADVSASANITPSKIAGTAATLGGTQTFTGRNAFADSVKFCDNTMQVDNGRVLIGGSTVLPDHGLLQIGRSVSTEFDVGGLDITLSNPNEGWGGLRGMYIEATGTAGPASGITCYASTDYSVRTGAYFDARTRTAYLNAGTSYGVRGVGSYGASNYGLHGQSYGGIEGKGVFGLASGASYEGVGVSGLSSGNPNLALGTYGGATASAWGYGVFGEAWGNSITNWAAYFVGAANVTGDFFSGSPAVRIDHPLDPENKYLQHSQMQSPDMLNVYTGNIITDSNGDADVTMPDYFTAINSDFRYQLTVVGQFAQAIISGEIQDNRFSIKTDKPNVKVSWQVTGIRQDKYAQAHRVETEVAKLPQEAGKYLHPELYGFGPDRSTTAEIRESAMKAMANSKEQAKTNDAERKPEATPKK